VKIAKIMNSWSTPRDLAVEIRNVEEEEAEIGGEGLLAQYISGQ
jgi:hypothetical protein